MDTGANFIGMLVAMMLVMATSFLKGIGYAESVLLFYGLITLLAFLALCRRILSYKVNIVQQYGAVVSIEPKTESRFFVNLYKAINFLQPITSGSFCGALMVLLSNRYM